MKKTFISVVYDRKKKACKTGIGKVELSVYLSREERKYITIKSCNPIEWQQFSKSKELASEISLYENIILNMVRCEEALTIANLDRHLGKAPDSEKRQDQARRKRLNSSMGFIEFIKEEMEKEGLSKGTLIRRKVVIDALERYGHLNSFADLTSQNVKGFDDFLRKEDKTRTESCLNNYHKVVKKYSRLAFEMDYVVKNPYKSPLCHFKRGESKQRRPLTEEELASLIALKDLPLGEEHARDLFIFSAYTGLAYGDTQIFDYKMMTETIDDKVFIDGSRIKNGHSYFTPILPPALAVLVKYDYKLPKMSNQDLNRFLHVLESRAGITKPITSHVARHTFACLILNYDTPIEDLARMMGHFNIRTTQIYAKISKKNVLKHTDKVIELINGKMEKQTDSTKHRGRPKKQSVSVNASPAEPKHPVHDIPPTKVAAPLDNDGISFGWGYSYTYS